MDMVLEDDFIQAENENVSDVYVRNELFRILQLKPLDKDEFFKPENIKRILDKVSAMEKELRFKEVKI